MTESSSEDVEFVFDDEAMHRQFQSWDGPTGVFMRQKAEQVEGLARISAGFETGRLIASIGTDYTYSTPTMGTTDLEAHTGANPHDVPVIGYAYWQHEGTWPHEIRARMGGVLRFSKRGIVVFARHVWHPGTTPVKYLSRWLRDIV